MIETLFGLSIAAIFLSLVVIAVYLIVLAAEFIRSKIQDVPFETPLEKFMDFWIDSFLPSMFLLSMTLMVLKLIMEGD